MHLHHCHPGGMKHQANQSNLQLLHICADTVVDGGGVLSGVEEEEYQGQDQHDDASEGGDDEYYQNEPKGES